MRCRKVKKVKVLSPVDPWCSAPRRGIPRERPDAETWHGIHASAGKRAEPGERVKNAVPEVREFYVNGRGSSSARSSRPAWCRYLS